MPKQECIERELAMSIEAMKQALKALEANQPINYCMNGNGERFPMFTEDPFRQERNENAITALRAAIEQAEKPVAWMYDFLSDNEVIRDWVTQSQDDIRRENGFNVRPLYTAPSAVTQKPIAYADSRIHGWPDCFVMEPDPPHTVPLYTEPREWIELTDDEARALVNRATFGDRTNWQALVYMVDAKLKEKNAA